MSLIIRSGAVAMTAMIALAGCSSTEDTSAEDSDNPICAATDNYLKVISDKYASFDPELQTASPEEQKKAQQELMNVMAEQTRLLAEKVPSDAPEDVAPAFAEVSKGEEQSAETPEFQAANETITKYIEAECPGLFPDPSAPPQPDGSPAPDSAPESK